jgi:hypothetical protein
MSGVGVTDVATRSSRIASITIGGQVLGTLAGGDHFGFVAQTIGPVRIGGTAQPMTIGNGNDDLALGITGDLRVNEVA